MRWKSYFSTKVRFLRRRCLLPRAPATNAKLLLFCLSSRRVYDRHLEVFWPKDNAILDCQCLRETDNSLLKSNTTGVLIVEVPLTTRHIANVQFSYEVSLIIRFLSLEKT
jgi:hypothetical protein